MTLAPLSGANSGVSLGMIGSLKRVGSRTGDPLSEISDYLTNYLCLSAFRAAAGQCVSRNELYALQFALGRFKFSTFRNFRGWCRNEIQRT